MVPKRRICIRWIHKGDVTRVCWLFKRPDGHFGTTGFKDEAPHLSRASLIVQELQCKVNNAALVYADTGL